MTVAHLQNILSLVAAASTLSIAHADSSQSVADFVFGGSDNLKIFLSANRATVARVHHKSEAEAGKAVRAKFKDKKFFDEGDPAAAEPERHVMLFYTSDAPVALSTDDIQMLKKLLSEPRSYLWSNGAPIIKSCIPEYAVLFKFCASSKAVSILLCFRCDQIGLLLGADDDPQRVNSEDSFDPIRPQLLALVKRLFPKDAELQALSPQRPP